jgi:hypothetical protein
MNSDSWPQCLSCCFEDRTERCEVESFPFACTVMFCFHLLCSSSGLTLEKWSFRYLLGLHWWVIARQHIHASGRIHTREPCVRAISARQMVQIFPTATGLSCACHFYMNSNVFKNGLRTSRVNQGLDDRDTNGSSSVVANLSSLLRNKTRVGQRWSSQTKKLRRAWQWAASSGQLDVSSGDNEDEYGIMNGWLKGGNPWRDSEETLLTHSYFSHPKSNPRRGDEKSVSNRLSYIIANSNTDIPETGS